MYTSKSSVCMSCDMSLWMHALVQEELEPTLGSREEEEELGLAHVIKVFQMTGSKSATIGGSVVDEGKMVRSALFRILRKNQVDMLCRWTCYAELLCHQ